MSDSWEEIEAQLTGCGGPFEVVEEDVLGQSMQVFASRMPSLRVMLESSAAFGDAEYIVYEDRRITFAEHLELVRSTAAALRSAYGVSKGDRVAILAANCPEWIIAFWAVTSLGAIAVGLNGWWSAGELIFGIDDCDPVLLIGDARRLERLSACDLSIPVVEIESGFDELSGFDKHAALPDTPIAEDDPACLLYTSGTTGRPKGALSSHRAIVGLVGIQFFHGARLMVKAMQDGIVDASQPPPPNCNLINNPLFHVSGLYAGAVAMLAGGVKTVWMKGRFDPLRVMQIIEREKVTAWAPMGSMSYRVVNHPSLADYDLSSLRTVGSGGAPMSKDMQQKLREAFPRAAASMGLGYGLTECTALAAMNFGDELERYPDSAGRPLPTVQVEIRGDDGEAVPQGEEGEVCIRSPLVMLEYWRRPRETAETIRAGRWLHTGDIGRLEDGRLYIESRKRDLILRAAENVYPVEIEQCLELHPAVAEAAVIGVPHEELGQEVKAVVVAAEGAVLDSAELRDWVAGRLAYFKVPAHWELRTQALPRNAAGKVMKHVLRGDASNPFVEQG